MTDVVATVPPKWGTLTDAAEHLRLSSRTVRRMIAAGEVDARKFGGQVRVDMTTLDDAGKALAWSAN